MTLPSKIYFCTGNEKKWHELQAILEPHLPKNVSLCQAKVDLPELQGSLMDIAKEKCRLASEQLKGEAVITEDTSLGFDDMKGLPGPYIKWFLEALGLSGLAHMAKSYSGNTKPAAKAVCTLAFFDPHSMTEPILLTGTTEGCIVEPRGLQAFGWDPVFQPIGFTETYAEMPKVTKNTISHRSRALKALVDHFSACNAQSQ